MELFDSVHLLYFDMIRRARLTVRLTEILLFLIILLYYYLHQNRARGGRRGTLYVGQHGWLAKKNLVLKWFKKAEITLETISVWQNISISIFKFSPFLSIKSYQFFKIY